MPEAHPKRPTTAFTDIDFDKQGRQIGSVMFPHSPHEDAWGVTPVPIAVIANGKGPTVIMEGGNHGDEHEGPIVIGELARDLDPGAIQGRLILMPAVNVSAVIGSRRTSPVDGLNINRTFPGDPNGSITQQISAYLTDTILPMGDAFIDLHSGGSSLDFLPSAIMEPTKDEAHSQAQSRGGARVRRALHGLRRQSRRSSHRGRDRVPRSASPRSGQRCAARAACRSKRWQICRRGVRNVLAHLGVTAPAGVAARCPKTSGCSNCACRRLMSMRRSKACSRVFIRWERECAPASRRADPLHVGSGAGAGNGLLQCRRCLVRASAAGPSQPWQLLFGRSPLRLIESAVCPPLKILVAGAGPFGQEHLMRLAARDDVQLVGLADPDPGARQSAREQFGVETCVDDTSKLIDTVAADAIIVATPADTHVAIATHALDAGLCVLLEKPTATSAEGARALIAAAARASGFVMPGHVLRFSRDHQRLVEIVRSGRIGSLLYVNSRRYRDDDHARRFPHDDPVLMTLVHDIDLAQWVTGAEFDEAHADRVGGPGFRSMTALRATTSTGVVCELRTTWTFDVGEAPPDLLEAVGDRGSVELTVGKGVTLYCEGRIVTYATIEGDDALRNEHDHFLARVRDRSLAPAVGLAEALVGLKLADAAMESLRERRVVAINS